jgi:DNA-binding GntR family transcriptional regulator
MRTSNDNNESGQHKINLTDKVRHIIEQKILEGTYRPDQHLTEQELSGDLGVSRTPLREALRQLEVTGYLARRKSVGYVVARLSEQDLGEIFEVRKILETTAARLACKNVSGDQLERAGVYLAKYDEELANPSLRDYDDVFWGLGNWNSLFHEEIYQASANKVLVTHINSLRDMARLKYATQFFHHQDLLEFQRQHYLILEAVKHRSAEEAESAVKLHLNTLYELLHAVFMID